VIVHDHARRFASLQLGSEGREVALSWRSDAIEPIVVEDGGCTWLGVDQRVVGIRGDSTTVFALGLPSLLLELQHFGDLVAIVCEAEVITVNLDGSIRGIHPLDDLPTAIEATDGTLVVTYDDGRREPLT
jgi:hypothetical protein